MLIPKTAEYALRAVVWLAGQDRPSLSREEIARGTRVPPGYLSKVLSALKRAGILSSLPGRSGGFALQRSPGAISVLEVVNAISPLQRIRTCPLGLASHGERLCALHERLDLALATTEAAFAATSIADILAEPTESIPLHEAIAR
jgi:Rrf2 family transcriptional regulator, nitric oxide-sensitive transcriptional repressor